MNYNDMMRNVAGSTGLTRRQADEAVVTTLTVLAEIISADETRDLLAQLPKSFRERVPLSGTTLPMRPIEFLARVSDLTPNPADIDVETKVRAVFAVLTQAVNSGEMNDIAEELGDEFADLLDRTQRVEREAARETLDPPVDTVDPQTDFEPRVDFEPFDQPAPTVIANGHSGGRSLVDLALSVPVALAHLAIGILRKPVQSGIDLIDGARR